MDAIPVVQGVDMQTVGLLALWVFVVVQFNKGKVWPNKWTAAITLGLPFLLAWVPVWGSPAINAYAQVVAIIFLGGSGFWAITKVGRTDQVAK